MTAKRILVAVDGSDQSLEAVRYASTALLPGSEQVVLFHVFSKISEAYYDLGDIPHYHPTAAAVKQWELQNEKAMEDFMKRATESFLNAGFQSDSVTVKIQPRQKDTAKDILAEALTGYDGVIVGRIGKSKLKDLVLGSVAFKLLGALSETPLWVIGGSPRAGKILVALDTSEGAMRSVDYVARMFAGTPSIVGLAHVARVSNIYEETYEEVFHVDKFQEQLEEARKKMDPVFKEAKDRLVKAQFDPSKVTTKFISGKASRANALAEEAKAEGYETIVLGRRGLSKVQEFFIGRVSNKVIQLAKEAAVIVVN